MLLRLAHYECLSNYSLANIVQIPLPPSSNGDGSQQFLETTWHISFSSIHFEYRRSYIIEKEKKDKWRGGKKVLSRHQKMWLFSRRSQAQSCSNNSPSKQNLCWSMLIISWSIIRQLVHNCYKWTLIFPIIKYFKEYHKDSFC